MRGDERSFPVRVHGPSGETRRHRTSIERGLFQSTEERRYFRRGLCQLSRGLARQLHDDFARLSRLVQQQGRGSLSAGHQQTVCLLPATWYRHVQARHQRTCSTTFQRRPTLPSLTRRIKIFIISSKITWLADLHSFFTAITRKGSPRYVRTSTERPLVRVGPSSDTMPTPCTCGHSCKTCLWDGTRDDGKRTTSDPNRRSCTVRWLRNG